MNDVKEILDALDFGEVRFAGRDDWRPTADLDGEMGTTDDTRIHLPRSFELHARLLDAETGALIAHARKAYPIDISAS